MKLIEMESGNELKVGSVVCSVGGKLAEIVSLRPPQKPNAKGKVFVEFADGSRNGYTPDVFGAKFE